MICSCILTKKGNDENAFNFGLGKPRKYHIIQFQISKLFLIFLLNIIRNTKEPERIYLETKYQLSLYILIAQSGDYLNKRLSQSIEIQKR